MILTVEEARRFIKTDDSDEMLASRIRAVEASIRSYTNNNFMERTCRRLADIHGGIFIVDASTPFEVGDTVQVSVSDLNDGLYTVRTVDDSTFTVNGPVRDEMDVLVTRVVYPDDVKMGAVNILRWELQNREKVGVSSETISRHSVTYFDQSDGNTSMGYPVSLMGFLKPYIKARFGQGLSA